MQQMYFTSDLHFYHKNILKFCDRPIGDKTNEQWLFDQIAELPRGATLWHLGDLCFNNAELKAILQFIIVDCGLQLNMLLGNHCNKQAIQRAVREILEENRNVLTPIIRDYYELSAGQLQEVLGAGYKERLGIKADKVVLFHFPIHEWNKCHRDALHFHGHCHGNLEGQQMRNRIDVGIDSLGKIMTLEEVIKELAIRNKVAIMEPMHH